MIPHFPPLPPPWPGPTPLADQSGQRAMPPWGAGMPPATGAPYMAGFIPIYMLPGTAPMQPGPQGGPTQGTAVPSQQADAGSQADGPQTENQPAGSARPVPPVLGVSRPFLPIGARHRRYWG